MNNNEYQYNVEEVIDTIDSLKNIFETTYNRNFENYFTTGQCYYFAQILKTLFIGSEIYESFNEAHCITKIGDNYYDANKLYTYDTSGYMIVNDSPADLASMENHYCNQNLVARMVEEQVRDYLINAIKNEQLSISKSRTR